MVDVEVNRFPSSSTPNKTCNLVNAIKNAALKCSEFIVFIPSGTGMRLADFLGSETKVFGAAKDTDSNFVMIVSNTWDTVKDIQAYVFKYSKETLDPDNAKLFVGRVRPLALFVEQMILSSNASNLELNEKFQIFLKQITTKGDLWSLYCLSDNKKCDKECYVKVMGILKQCIYLQICFEFPYTSNDDYAIELFELAFGIIYKVKELTSKV